VAPYSDPTDFGSQGVEYTLQQQADRSVAAAALDNSQGLGQPQTATQVAPLIDPTDFGSMAATFIVNPQFATSADAVYVADGLAVATAPVAALGDALGIGQPDESAKSNAATLIDPTDFGSMAATSITYPQFGTSADAIHAANPQVSSDDGYIGQLVNGAYVIESGADLR
jgi:hypothetical protein